MGQDGRLGPTPAPRPSDDFLPPQEGWAPGPTPEKGPGRGFTSMNLLSSQPGRSDWVPVLQMLREIKSHALLPASGPTPCWGLVPEPLCAH